MWKWWCLGSCVGVHSDLLFWWWINLEIVWIFSSSLLTVSIFVFMLFSYSFSVCKKHWEIILLFIWTNDVIICNFFLLVINDWQHTTLAISPERYCLFVGVGVVGWVVWGRLTLIIISNLNLSEVKLILGWALIYAADYAATREGHEDVRC